VSRQVSQFLGFLHSLGFVYGDLKPGNIVYNEKINGIHIIDYGSVTVKGHFIKQYTPGYDRVSWQAGDRTANEKYDVFSLGMLLAVLVLGKLHRGSRYSLEDVISRVNQRVRHETLKYAIIYSLQQDTISCRKLADQLSAFPGEVTHGGNCPETKAFVNYVGVVSIVSFVLSLAFYYQ